MLTPVANTTNTESVHTTDPRLKQSAQEFESMLLSELLKMGDDGSPTDGELDQGCQEGYQDLRIQAVATAMARNGGIGIARMLECRLGAAANIKDFSSSADTQIAGTLVGS